MPFSYFDHTGDIGVDLRASTLTDLFWEAAASFVETVAGRAAVVPEATLDIRLAAADVDLLLHDWLSELLFRFDTSGFLPASAVVEISHHAGHWHLAARVSGEHAAASRLPILVLPKAVTYHALRVEETDAGWVGRVVLDV